MPRQRFTRIALALTALFSTASFANITENSSADDIVISASRIESKRIESGSAITVLDQQYLKENQARSVAEVLQNVPGVSVTNSGGFGQPTSVFIRGASSSNTLVIIDGIEVNDLTTSAGSYDFAHLMVDSVERIEILRGSQSALWGSDAMGGVINIVTKKGQAGFNPTANIEIGENSYHKETINLNGAKGNSHYSFSASNMKTDGISARKNESDDDSYENQNITLKAGHQFNDIFTMDAVLLYNDSESEYDSYGTDSDSGYYSTSRQHQAKLNTNIELLNKQWKNRISIAVSDSERKHFAASNTKFEGTKIKTDLQSDYYFTPVDEYTQRLSFIAEHEKDEYEDSSSERDMETSGIVLGYGADWEKTIFANAALRHDFNDSFDDTTTYHIDISAWASDGTRLHASHGTGSKNPTFYQLYGYYGNTSLKPEESLSWDAGIEYNFSALDAYLDLTYFDSSYTDMIDTECNASWVCTFYNVDEATARGVELTGSLKISKDFRANANYTYTDTDNGDGDQLARRPKHSASINANYKYTPNLSANIGVNYVGKRLDTNYSPLEVDSYTVINIALAYQVNEHIILSTRIENAFDKDYEEASNYNTDDRTAYIGVSFK